jgi:hypothetical protein
MQCFKIRLQLLFVEVSDHFWWSASETLRGACPFAKNDASALPCEKATKGPNIKCHHTSDNFLATQSTKCLLRCRMQCRTRRNHLYSSTVILQDGCGEALEQALALPLSLARALARVLALPLLLAQVLAQALPLAPEHSRDLQTSQADWPTNPFFGAISTAAGLAIF